jgi:hypothetical protein
MKKMHPKILLLHFRTKEPEYAQARKRWTEAFDDVVRDPAQAEWKDWFADQLHDGTGIFSRVSQRLRKGVTINQVLPADDSLVFRAWMSTFGTQQYGDEIERLTIQCMLTDDSVSRAKALIKAFIVDHFSRQEMDKRCSAATQASETIEA